MMPSLSQFKEDILNLSKEGGDLYQKLADKYGMTRPEAKAKAFPFIYGHRLPEPEPVYDNLIKQSREAELTCTHMAQFLLKHPEIQVAQIHDSLLFQSLEDAKLYLTEWEQFQSKRRPNAQG